MKDKFDIFIELFFEKFGKKPIAISTPLTVVDIYGLLQITEQEYDKQQNEQQRREDEWNEVLAPDS